MAVKLGLGADALPAVVDGGEYSYPEIEWNEATGWTPIEVRRAVTVQS